MGGQDQRMSIDEQLIADFAGSDSFELRQFAGKALVHEIWSYGHTGQEAQAISAARRLVSLFEDDAESGHLIDISEMLLSGAEKLNHRRIW
jgi:hypothetical protein